MAKLNLDRDKIDECRAIAEECIHPIQKYVSMHSSLSVERATLRLFGLYGAWEDNGASPEPLVNFICKNLNPRRLPLGISTWLAAAKLKEPKLPFFKLALKIAQGRIDLNTLQEPNPETVKKTLKPWVNDAIKNLDRSRRHKERAKQLGRSSLPLKYLLLATGNIYEDLKLAIEAAENGADIISIIRSSSQNQLDYIPHGATTEGHGGTYFTQDNVRILRKGLDEASKRLRRYVKLCFQSAGPCTSEIAVIASNENVDYVLSDSLYDILFQDLNMKRSFVDMHFARLILGRSGVIIQTREEITQKGVYENHHQALAAQFLNEQFAKNAGLREDQIGLCHSFGMNPELDDSYVYELAAAQLMRDVFPRHPIRFISSKNYQNNDKINESAMSALFHIAGASSRQAIQALKLNDHDSQNRFLYLKQANSIFKNSFSLSDEISFNSNGKIARRARTILDNTHSYLEKIKTIGLMPSIEQGLLSDQAKKKDDGYGLDGIFQKNRRYTNPFLEILSPNS